MVFLPFVFLFLAKLPFLVKNVHKLGPLAGYWVLKYMAMSGGCVVVFSHILW